MAKHIEHLNKQTVKRWKRNPNISITNEKKLNRARIGHSRMTHGYLMAKCHAYNQTYLRRMQTVQKTKRRTQHKPHLNKSRSNPGQ